MTLKFLLVLGLVPLALAAVTRNISVLSSHFEKFEKDFGKSYRSAEERSTRFVNFVKNFQDMEEHNQVKLIDFSTSTKTTLRLFLVCLGV